MLIRRLQPTHAARGERAAHTTWYCRTRLYVVVAPGTICIAPAPAHVVEAWQSFGQLPCGLPRAHAANVSSDTVQASHLEPCETRRQEAWDALTTVLREYGGTECKLHQLWDEDLACLADLGPDLIAQRAASLLQLFAPGGPAATYWVRQGLARWPSLLLAQPPAEVLSRMISLSNALGVSVVAVPELLFTKGCQWMLRDAETARALEANTYLLAAAVRKHLPCAKRPLALAQAVACCLPQPLLGADCDTRRVERRLRELHAYQEGSRAASNLAARGYPPEESARRLAQWLFLRDDSPRVYYLQYKYEFGDRVARPDLDPLIASEADVNSTCGDDEAFQRFLDARLTRLTELLHAG